MMLLEKSIQDSITRAHNSRLLFNKLNDFLTEKCSILHQGLERFTDADNNDQYIIPFGQFLHLINHKPYDPKYDKLYIVFASKKEGTDGSLQHTYNGTYNLVLYIIEKNNPATIASNFPNVDSIFIHEMTHFDDLEKRKNRTNIKSTNQFKNIAAPKENELAEYYSTPEEYNAYYIQCIDLIEQADSLNTIHYECYADFITSIYNTYIKQPFFDNLNLKYKRKLLRRLYKYFDFKKARINLDQALV